MDWWSQALFIMRPQMRPLSLIHIYDMTTKTITTHFDYHSIDHNLLKLDILGHDDPTMIRMLQDLTGLDPVKDIPLDSREVMSLFQSTDALGIKPEDIGGCKLGALGVPEFGTDFAMQMLSLIHISEDRRCGSPCPDLRYQGRRPRFHPCRQRDPA